jgi:hypothetical protein
LVRRVLVGAAAVAAVAGAAACQPRPDLTVTNASAVDVRVAIIRDGSESDAYAHARELGAGRADGSFTVLVDGGKCERRAYFLVWTARPARVARYGPPVCQGQDVTIRDADLKPGPVPQP